jgi:hypothetical protein
VQELALSRFQHDPISVADDDAPFVRGTIDLNIGIKFINPGAVIKVNGCQIANGKLMPVWEKNAQAVIRIRIDATNMDDHAILLITRQYTESLLS